MTEYFAQVITELADEGVLEEGQTVEECCNEMPIWGFVAWKCLETEPGLLSHVVTEKCLETANEVLG